MNKTQEKMLAVAKQLSDLIAEEIKKKSSSNFLGKEFGKVGKGGDLSKYGDVIAEKVVIKHLKSLVKKNSFDQIILITEESGIHNFSSTKDPDDSKSIFIILDPVDGSNNMRPWRTPKIFVGTSIAIGSLSNLKKHPNLSAVEVGLIRDIFYDLNFYAVLKGGAFFSIPKSKKTVPLKTSRSRSVDKSLLAISLDKSNKQFEKIIKRLMPLLKVKKCQRRLGSTVLDLSRVSSGEFDAFVSVSGNVKIHDIAAGKLIIEEAGGIVDLRQVRGSNTADYLSKLVLEGQDNLIQGIGFETIAAGNKELLNEIKKLLK